MTIRSLDNFLIDRLFQPCADRLAVIASCHAIAAFLITGAALLHLATFCWLSLSGQPIYLLVALAETGWMSDKLLLAYRLGRQQSQAVIFPKERLHGCPFRIMVVLITMATQSMLQFFPFEIFDAGVEGGWWLSLGGLYFLACRRTPPKQPVRKPVQHSVQHVPA